MKLYSKGSLVRVSFEFRQESDDSLHDPTAVFFTWKVNDGTATLLTYLIDAALVKDATGQYHVDIDASAAGIYKTRAYATGTGQSAEERHFEATSNFL